MLQFYASGGVHCHSLTFHLPICFIFSRRRKKREWKPSCLSLPPLQTHNPLLLLRLPSPLSRISTLRSLSLTFSSILMLMRCKSWILEFFCNFSMRKTFLMSQHLFILTSMNFLLVWCERYSEVQSHSLTHQFFFFLGLFVCIWCINAKGHLISLTGAIFLGLVVFLIWYFFYFFDWCDFLIYCVISKYLIFLKGIL